MKNSLTARLAVQPGLDLPARLSWITAVLLAAASLAGLFFQTALYPTEALRRSFVSNDVVNLFIGLPMLLGSLALARRGQLLGLLFWPGALLYVTYNYQAYAAARPLTWQFIPYLALVVLSVAALISLLSRLDRAEIQRKIGGQVPEKWAGGVLLGFGILFFLRSLGQAAGALSGATPLAGPELAVLVADFLTMPLWITGGALLWRKHPLGYLTGAGLLFQASLLFIGLLVFFLLQPFLAGVPFPAADFIVIFVMGLFCFVPFGLFVRGILISSR